MGGVSRVRGKDVTFPDIFRTEEFTHDKLCLIFVCLIDTSKRWGGEEAGEGTTAYIKM